MFYCLFPNLWRLPHYWPHVLLASMACEWMSLVISPTFNTGRKFSGQVCRWPTQTIISLHLTLACVITCHSQMGITLLLWLVKTALYWWHARQQSQLPRTCRAHCIPNPCAHIALKALLIFHIPWADLVIWHFVRVFLHLESTPPPTRISNY